MRDWEKTTEQEAEHLAVSITEMLAALGEVRRIAGFLLSWGLDSELDLGPVGDVMNKVHRDSGLLATLLIGAGAMMVALHLEVEPGKEGYDG